MPYTKCARRAACVALHREGRPKQRPWRNVAVPVAISNKNFKSGGPLSSIPCTWTRHTLGPGSQKKGNSRSALLAGWMALMMSMQCSLGRAAPCRASPACCSLQRCPLMGHRLRCLACLQALQLPYPARARCSGMAPACCVPRSSRRPSAGCRGAGGSSKRTPSLPSRPRPRSPPRPQARRSRSASTVRGCPPGDSHGTYIFRAAGRRPGASAHSSGLLLLRLHTRKGVIVPQ